MTTPPSEQGAAGPAGDMLAARELAASFRKNPREASLQEQEVMRLAAQDPLRRRASLPSSEGAGSRTLTDHEISEAVDGIFLVHGRELADKVLCALYAAPVVEPGAQAGREAEDAARLDWLLRHLPGDALRYCVGELADTADEAEFRAAIDAARATQGDRT